MGKRRGIGKSHGYRSRTRDKFARAYKTKGHVKLSQYMIAFKRGDYVDIKTNGSQHKGMAYQYYHGRTGIVYNVTKNAVGLLIPKVIGNREIQKKVHVRVEHCRKSRCNEDFLRRVKENDKLKEDAKKRGEKVVTKRVPPGPRDGYIAAGETTVLSVLPFVDNPY